jgi:hypothetical protein
VDDRGANYPIVVDPLLTATDGAMIESDQQWAQMGISVGSAGDVLSYILTSNPTNGTLSGTAPNLFYTPNAGYNGTDTFKFMINDGTVNSNEATVTITINATGDGGCGTGGGGSGGGGGCFINTMRF